MLNLSVSFLSLSRISGSPLFTQRMKLSLKKSKFSYFSTNFFFSKSKFLSKITDSEFSKFTKSVILFENEEKVFDYPYAASDRENILMENVLFKNIHAGNYPACIENAPGERCSSLTIKSSRFINCSSNGQKAAGLILLDECDTDIHGCCFENCFSTLRIHTFYISKSQICKLNYSSFDQCAPKKERTLDTPFMMKTENEVASDINLTRCFARDRNCLGCFEEGVAFYYQFAYNNNCSGKVFYEIDATKTRLSIVRNSVLVRCLPHQGSGEGILDIGGSLDIYEFTFINTKMLFTVVKRWGLKIGNVTFIDCVGDVELNKLNTINPHVKVKNYTHLNKENMSIMPTPVFESWRCATDDVNMTRTIQRTKKLAVATQQSQKTDDKEQEEKEDNTLDIWIDVVFVSLILITAVVFYILCHSKKKTKQEIDEEKQLLNSE